MRERLGPGLGIVCLIALIAVAVGCGQTTTPTDRDGGVSAAPAATAADAPSAAMPTSVALVPTASSIVPAAPPSSTASAPDSSLLASVPPALDSRDPLSPDSEPEVSVPDAIAINTARVVVNQSNIVSTGPSRSSESRSVVDSSAAKLVVRLAGGGLEIVSVDVRPGWTEASRSQSADRLALRYVSGTSTVDITLTSNGTAIASSVVTSSDR